MLNGYPSVPYRGTERPRPSRVPARRVAPRRPAAPTARPARPPSRIPSGGFPVGPRTPQIPFGRRPPVSAPYLAPKGPVFAGARLATRLLSFAGAAVLVYEAWNYWNSAPWLFPGAWTKVASCSVKHPILWTFWEWGQGLNNPATYCLDAQAIGGENTNPLIQVGSATGRKTFWAVYLASLAIGLKKQTLERWDRTAYLNTPANAAPSLPEKQLKAMLALHPALYPEAAAEWAPMYAYPIAPPYWAVPYLTPIPFSPQTREVGPLPVPPNNPAWRFSVELTIHPPSSARGEAGQGDDPALLISGKPDFQLQPTLSPFAGRKPARPGEDEKKRSAPERVRAVIGKALAGISEVDDFVESLFAALPAGVQASALRNARKSKTPGPVARAVAVVDNIDEIDWDIALQNLAENEVEDQLVGRALGRARKAANRIDPSGGLWASIQWMD